MVACHAFRYGFFGAFRRVYGIAFELEILPQALAYTLLVVDY